MTNANASDDAAYIDVASKREFWIFTLATFLAFFTNTQAAYLSVLLQRAGLSTHDIGIVLAAYGAGVLVFSFLSGAIANKLGVLLSVRVGLTAIALGYASHEITFGNETGMIVSRFVQGAGFGIFLAPAMSYAKSRLGKQKFIYLFGVYASMVPLPQAFGPALAELYATLYGTNGLFTVGSIPIVLALLLTIPLRSLALLSGAAAPLSFLQVARSPAIRIPLFAIAVVGVMFGFITSFMALVLTQKAIPIAAFFSTFSIAMFASRFLLLRRIDRYSRQFVVASGLLLMGLSYSGVAIADGSVIAIAAGILFGLGYSVAYPLLSTWATEGFDAAARTTPLAVFNTVFNAGILLTPYLVGLFVEGVGYGRLLALFSVAAVITAAIVALVTRNSTKELGSAQR